MLHDTRKMSSFSNTWDKAVYKADLKDKPLIITTTEAVVLLQTGVRRGLAGPMAPHSHVSRCPLFSLSPSLSLHLSLILVHLQPTSSRSADYMPLIICTCTDLYACIPWTRLSCPSGPVVRQL